MIKDTKIDPGGLFRCCMDNFINFAKGNPSVKPGQVIECPHCKAEIVLWEDLTWRLNSNASRIK